MQHSSGDAPAPKLRLKLPSSAAKPATSSDSKPALPSNAGAAPTLKFKLTIPASAINKDPAPTHAPQSSSHAQTQRSQAPHVSSRPITSRSPSPPPLPRARSPYEPHRHTSAVAPPGSASPYSQQETRSHGPTHSPLSTSTSPAVHPPHQLNAQPPTAHAHQSHTQSTSNSGVRYKTGMRPGDNSPSSSAHKQPQGATGWGGARPSFGSQSWGQEHGGTPPQSMAPRPPISRPGGMTRSHSQTFSGSRDAPTGSREEHVRDGVSSAAPAQPKIILRPGVIKQEAAPEPGVKIEVGMKQEYVIKSEPGFKAEVVVKQEPGLETKSAMPRLILKSSGFLPSDSHTDEGGHKHKKHKKEKKEKKEKDRDKEKKKQQGSVISSASRYTLSGSTPTNKHSQYDSDNDSDFDVSPANQNTSYCIFGSADFSRLKLKSDHSNRPLWVTPDGRIFLETYSPIYKQAYDFLIAISEPQCRPENVHEYQLTPHSLYAAVSVGLDTQTIIDVLGRLSKVDLSDDIIKFIRESTENYGKVKLLLKHNRFYVESKSEQILNMLKHDAVISQAVVRETHGAGSKEVGKDGRRTALEQEAAAGMAEDALDADPEQICHSFEIQPQLVEKVKERCLPGAGGLNYPMLEEYDFRNDRTMADLNAELKPHVKLRPYQEKSLTKMFGNGRARSGIIVLPCGAGKSLVGVASAIRVHKSCLCLCTSSVSVDQWRHQFLLWTTLQKDQVAGFTSDNREMFKGDAGIMVTTFTMVAFRGKRSAEGEQVFQEICNREWGLLLLDEVHVVPAAMFRKVISIIRAHCKLGLTATLLREDERISDLNFLIGPKLYEANWLDLTRAGHIANVQCAEVWCPMAPCFFQEYLSQSSIPKKQLLYAMNPNKFMACEFLVKFHQQRGDKIIVFSDNIFALQTYAIKLGKPYIYGPTAHPERISILHQFKHSPKHNVVFLSKVGDTSIDIPEANVLIQISSHAGSRRQEAQRLGRILRAKKDKSQPLDEPNAFFYTLVSTDTQEMYFSAKRQQFLIDQGYSFKVLDDILASARQMGYSLNFSTPQEQKDLLDAVLAAKDDVSGIEHIEGEDDDLVQSSGRTALRRQHAMAAVERAVGMDLTSHLTGNKRSRRSNMSEKAKKLHKALAKLAPV